MSYRACVIFAETEADTGLRGDTPMDGSPQPSAEVSSPVHRAAESGHKPSPASVHRPTHQQPLPRPSAAAVRDLGCPPAMPSAGTCCSKAEPAAALENPDGAVHEAWHGALTGCVRHAASHAGPLHAAADCGMVCDQLVSHQLACDSCKQPGRCLWSGHPGLILHHAHSVCRGAQVLSVQCVCS